MSLAEGSVPIKLLGHIAQLWRYPVKSMQGERCESLIVGACGIDGDRRLALESDDAPVGKPLLRSIDRSAMLRSAATLNGAGEVTVRTASGLSVSATDEALTEHLRLAAAARALRLIESERPLTDVRPIAVHSLGTERALAEALGGFDGRRLRSNIILRFADDQPFFEDELSGMVLQLGGSAQISMLERIPRCRMVSLDPDTAEADPAILRWLATTKNGRAGLYARTLQPGLITVGDPVRLLTPLRTSEHDTTLHHEANAARSTDV